MASDIDLIVNAGHEMGLNLNVAKCELIQQSNRTVSDSLLASFKQVDPPNMSLLGSPLMPGPEQDRRLEDCCVNLTTAIRRMELIEAHDALVLLRSSFCAPKMQYILRCSPCYGHQALSFDNVR